MDRHLIRLALSAVRRRNGRGKNGSNKTKSKIGGQIELVAARMGGSE